MTFEFKTKVSSVNLSLVKKYMPLFVKDLFLEKGLRKKFYHMISKKTIPNLLFTGPPGSGKTSGSKYSKLCYLIKDVYLIKNLVNCLIREIFNDSASTNILKLNASNESGVDLIREKIKNFCRKNTTKANYKIKLILIDEADSLTEVAQEALRRSMEIYSNKARFVLICNFPSKINESIQSRCTIFRFKKLKKELSLFLFLDLIKKEKIFFDLQSIEILIFYSDGDLRKILNYSEIFIKKVGLLNYKILQKSEFFLQSDKLLEYVIACYNNNVYIAQEILNDVWNNGICLQEIFTNLFQIIKNIDIAIKTRFEIINTICNLRLEIWRNIPSENLKKNFTRNLIKVFSV